MDWIMLINVSLLSFYSFVKVLTEDVKRSMSLIYLLFSNYAKH